MSSGSSRRRRPSRHAGLHGRSRRPPGEGRPRHLDRAWGTDRAGSAALTRPRLRATLLYRGLDAALSARCDAIVVPSHAIAQALVSRVGYPPGKIVVVPNGIDPPPQVRGAGELIGTLSLLEPVKGLDVFLR